MNNSPATISQADIVMVEQWPATLFFCWFSRKQNEMCKSIDQRNGKAPTRSIYRSPNGKTFPVTQVFYDPDERPNWDDAIYQGVGTWHKLVDANLIHGPNQYDT